MPSMTSSDGGGRAGTWNQQRLRSSNERLLLERLRAAPASRAQLARDSGLSKPTVSSALAALEAAGLVREAGHHTPGRGRVAVLYSPDPSAGYALGIDIGRAWLRVALADLDGTVVARDGRAQPGPHLGRDGGPGGRHRPADRRRVRGPRGQGRARRRRHPGRLRHRPPTGSATPCTCPAGAGPGSSTGCATNSASRSPSTTTPTSPRWASTPSASARAAGSSST